MILSAGKEILLVAFWGEGSFSSTFWVRMLFAGLKIQNPHVLVIGL
jgi:hypothetical protein